MKSRISNLNLTKTVAGILLATLAISNAHASVGSPTEQIHGLLSSWTSGKHPVAKQVIAPAQSLNTKATADVRVGEINARISNEIGTVVQAFKSAPDQSKIAATRQALAQFDAETAATGADRAFEGKSPSLALARQLVFLPTSALPTADPEGRVLEIISSFERSPKPADEYYEYSSTDLETSSVATLPGSPTSHLGSAQKPMRENEPMALKKCRKVTLLGWFCNTGLYFASTLSSTGASNDGKSRVLINSIYDLKQVADHAKFKGTDKGKNTTNGYTNLYVITRSGSYVLVYNLGVQTGDSSPGGMKASLLKKGHKEEYQQLLDRLSAELGVKF